MKFLKAIQVEEFKKLLNSIPKIVSEEEIISLEEAFNRVVFRDIISAINVPHFRKSSMDGYAVIAEDTFGAEEDNLITLNLIEIISAGDSPLKNIEKGQCSYVATGAAIPDNTNGVVMVEFTEREGDKITISKAITPETHIINIGHDVKKGDTICSRGSLINLPTLGLLSSCGTSQVSVYRKPIISLISTGNELLTHDTNTLEIGKIYDVNSIVLKKAIENTGANVKYLGIIKDDFEDLKNIISKALNESDIVILSGGTSKGEGDLGPQVLETYQNVDILVHGVRIKPGKPLIFAKLDQKILFILPGYPTSALSCFYVLIENFLRRMSGYPLKERKSKELEVGERIYSTVGRHEFKTVKIKEIDGIKKIFPIKTGSEAMSTIFTADGYIEIEELESIIEEGDKRRVYFF
jgi:molybdenum cofactor synthesis domain-containing protein